MQDPAVLIEAAVAALARGETIGALEMAITSHIIECIRIMGSEGRDCFFCTGFFIRRY